MSEISSMPDLTFGTACEILLETLNLDPDAGPAMKARIRQVQNLGLAKSDTPYARHDYGLAELAKLAAAFRMMQGFMLPIIAVRYLTERWEDLVPALIDGIDSEFLREIGAVVPVGHKPLVLIEGIALAQLGQKSANDKRYDGPLGRIERVSLDGVCEAGAGISSGLLLDTRSFMPGLINGLQARAVVTDRQMAHEIARLALS